MTKTQIDLGHQNKCEVEWRMGGFKLKSKEKRVPVKSIGQEIKNNLFFYLLPLPGIIFLILFNYVPMAGLYIVFEKYTYQGGLFGSEFVGLKNFEFFFKSIDNALRATRNTLIINGFSIVLGTVANVGIAIAINEIRNKWFRKVTQSVMLFPHFISWIVVGMISLTLLDENKGLLNQFILILTSVWKGAGYGSLIYFGALTGFDQSLYEAAEIDGANRWQRIMRITIPLLKPTIILMFLLNIGGILFGSVDQIMGMTNLHPLLFETTDTIATFVYRSAILNGQFESASAITLYQSIFGFILVMAANKLVKKFDPDYALF